MSYTKNLELKKKYLNNLVYIVQLYINIFMVKVNILTLHLDIVNGPKELGFSESRLNK
jgi:hypothetical protein